MFKDVINQAILSKSTFWKILILERENCHVKVEEFAEQWEETPAKNSEENSLDCKYSETKLLNFELPPPEIEYFAIFYPKSFAR